jgi:hypothetical protein
VKPLPIPEAEQLDAMLNGSFQKLLSDYIEKPPKFDFKKYITIDRRKLVKYLNENPNAATTFFQGQLKIDTLAAHDVEKIWQERDDYVVAWMDHGSPRNPRRFKTLAEAVAELVLVSYGMY